MLRILAGTLLSGTLLSAAAASSFLSPAPIEADSGPSFLVIGETREAALPVDETITASHGEEDEPRVIAAPRFVSLSASITAMPPAPEDTLAATSIAAMGEETETSPEPAAPQRVARQLEPMVIRGGLVGMAFPGATAPAPGEPPSTSASQTSVQPARTTEAAPPAAQPHSRSSGGSAAPQRQQSPAPRPDGRL